MILCFEKEQKDKDVIRGNKPFIYLFFHLALILQSEHEAPASKTSDLGLF